MNKTSFQYIDMKSREKFYIDFDDLVEFRYPQGLENSKFLVTTLHSGNIIPMFSWKRMEKDWKLHEDDIEYETSEIYDMTSSGGVLIRPKLFRNVVELNRDIFTDSFNRGERGVYPCLNLDGKKILNETCIEGYPYPEKEKGMLSVYYHWVYGSINGWMDAFKKVYGKALLIDGHSMSPRNKKSGMTRSINKGEKPDFSIGTLDGKSIEKGMIKTFMTALKDSALSYDFDPDKIEMNYFKGGNVVRSVTDPSRGKNGISIETNRRLYAENEKTDPERIRGIKEFLTMGIRAVFDDHIIK